MTLSTARRLLAVIWGAGGICLLALVFLLTTTRHTSHYERSELWNWTLSWVLPPLTAVVVTLRAKNDKRKLTVRVDWFFLGFVVLMSVLEIIAIGIVLSWSFGCQRSM